jgi:hypothetical protein
MRHVYAAPVHARIVGAGIVVVAEIGIGHTADYVRRAMGWSFATASLLVARVVGARIAVVAVLIGFADGEVRAGIARSTAKLAVNGAPPVDALSAAYAAPAHAVYADVSPFTGTAVSRANVTIVEVARPGPGAESHHDLCRRTIRAGDVA